MTRSKRLQVAAGKLANLCAEKNAAYGDSFDKCGEFLSLLYPEGIAAHQYQDMLTIARIFDKLMRIATDPEAFNEDPWQDIAGYALLSLTATDEENKNDRDT